MSLRKPINRCPKCNKKIQRRSRACLEHADRSLGKEAREKQLATWSKKHSADKCPSWVGERVGYFALQRWIRNKHGKADRCQNIFCNPKDGVPDRFGWNNVTGEKDRKIKNWAMLCASCRVRHGRYREPIQIK